MGASWKPYGLEKAPAGSPKLWDEWTDVLGQTYGPGDHVAVAVINGRSPQMVVGEVVRINRLDSKGCEHVEEFYSIEGDYQSPRERRPSCTVTVLPLIDARGFYRTGTGNRRWDVGKPVKPVTYQFWQNIIKVEVPDGP